MRMLVAAFAAFAVSLTATDAAALTTVSCSADPDGSASVLWPQFALCSGPACVTNVTLRGEGSLLRSCGREYRGTLTIRGSTVLPAPGVGPVATIAERAENACRLSGQKGGGYGSNDWMAHFACGAHVEFTWTLNGVQTTEVVHEGCQGYYTLPSAPSAATTSATGCSYPPENDATSSLQVPALSAEVSSCNGAYYVSWEHVPGATRYVLMRKLGNSLGDQYTTLYNGPNNYFSTFVSSSAKAATLWVRACSGANCGFHSEPRGITYYAGCP